MVRSVISVIAAVLFLLPGSGFAQQEVSGEDETVNPSVEIHAREAPVPPPRPRSVGPRPSPGAMAVRGSLVKALNSAVSFPKTIPTPPTGSWGIISEGTGGGGIFRDSDSEAEAWLGTAGVGVLGYGINYGGFFKDSDNSGQAYVGYANQGIIAYGNEVGGLFTDSDNSGYAFVGYGDSGIEAYGNGTGGYFRDIDDSGIAFVGHGDRGINAVGNEVGGYFGDGDEGAYAYVGYSGYGIDAYGHSAGGSFQDASNSGYARVGTGDWGIQAYGNDGGAYFADLNSSGWAHLGFGHRGVDARGYEAGGWFVDGDGSGFGYVAYDRPSGTDANGWANAGEYGVYGGGALAGGYFENSNGAAYAYIGYAYVSSIGIVARGNDAGGSFADKDSSGRAFVGYGDRGIEAEGNEMGGRFADGNQSGYAEVGVEDIGIRGYGDLIGGYFKDDNQSGRSWVGTEDYGIKGFGDYAGGQFEDTNSSSYGRVGYDTYKIYGTGAVSFVQNHPFDPGSVIVYAAPEGDEVATYTRGAARLIGGEATVSLGNTFKWVTNPDVGLTTFLTPVSEWCDLYVAGQATDEIVVRSRDGSDCDFNYMIYGLRIGFEESSIIQEKEREAYIPSMSSHRQLYQRRPEIQAFNSLERFKDMRHAMGQKDALDLSRAQALKDSIVEFDPAVHELQIPLMEKHPRPGHIGNEDAGGRVVSGEQVRTARPDHGNRRAPSRAELNTTIPADDGGNVFAPSVQPSSREVTSLMNVSETVEAGDVLVIDRGSADMVRRGFEGHDAGVVGVVSGNAGVLLGSQSPALLQEQAEGGTTLHAEVAMAGVVKCKVDATYGAIWPGDLLVTSPTSGHAMRTPAPLPGTIVGKALERLEEGKGLIRVLVMLR